MIKKICLVGVIIFPFLFTGQIFAQHYPDRTLGDTVHYPYYFEMMQDTNASFHATVSAFEKYWAGRTDTRHNGWKVFKRWEYIHKDMVQPDGKLPGPSSILRETRKYEQQHAPMSPGGTWTNVGPVAYPLNATSQPTGLGRVNCLGFDPVNANTIYAGTPSGGLWKSTDGGTTWTKLTEALPTLGVSSILVNPSNGNDIVIGTGDRDASDSYGLGMYRSTDGGITWNPSTGTGNITVGMMIRNPANVNMLLAATSDGIYKSTDGGGTWTNKFAAGYSFKDIKFKPGDFNTVFAAYYGYLYRSTNAGDNWTQITSGVLAGNRLVIGVCPSAPATVYLLQTSGPFVGLLKSTDSGLNFSTQSTSPNIMDYACDGSGTASQANYDLCITVDPANANTIYIGGINIWKSTEAGVTWTINSHWIGKDFGTTCGVNVASVHADQHVLAWSPLTTKLFVGDDGGVYYTTDGGTNWTQISNGLAIAQVYKIGQCATQQDLVINGFQDNGTAVVNGTTFTTVIGGDGMECLIDYSDPNYRYGETNGGDLTRFVSSGTYHSIKNNITESGAWVTPYILHQTDPNTMFAGFKNVWRTTNVKTALSTAVSWTAISTGETVTCDVIVESPANVDILYAVRGTVLKRTDNANAATPSWTTCTSPSGSNITGLATHPNDANTVYATAGTKVYKSIDKGSTWSDISGTLPAININCITYLKNSNEELYIGTKAGVYVRNADMPDWVSFSSGLPVTDVRELEVYYDANPWNNRIKAATYGRGLWTSDLLPVAGITWTGAVSTAWNTAGNWSNNAVPDNSKDVTIPAVTNMPVYTGNFTLGTTCRNLTLQPGSQLTATGNVTLSNNFYLINNGVLHVGGDWTDQGTTMTGTGTIEFYGNTSSTVYPSQGNPVYLINDGFSIWPGSWLGDIGTGYNTFNQNYTNNAGGVSPEAMYTYSLSTSNDTRRMYQVVNTSGLTALTLQFRHMVDNYGGGYTVKVQYSTNGTTWNDAGWSLTPVANVPANMVTVNLSAAQGVGSATYYISFTITGNLDYINYWYIDDVKLYYYSPTETFYNLAINKSNALTSTTSGTFNVSNNLNVKPGAWLTNSSGSTLTIGGNFTLESNAGATGSFIDLGTTTVTGTTSVQRYMTGNWDGTWPPTTITWHYVSSPVSGGTINSFLGALLNYWNEPGNTWTLLTLPLTTPLVVNKGYSAATTANGIITYTGGSLNNGNQAISGLTNTGASAARGFNLAGNAFPSAVRWDGSVTRTNVDAAAYLWSGSSYVSYLTTDVTPYSIPPEQGFYVHVTTGQSSGSMVIPNSNRVHSTNSYVKGSASEQLSLAVAGNNLEDVTSIRFNAASTEGFDSEYDAYKLWGIDACPQIYSIIPSDNLSINSLPEMTRQTVVPLGFRAGIADSYTITASGLETFPQGTEIYLEDVLLSKSQNLNVNPVYSFNASAGSTGHRFNIHFSAFSGIADGVSCKIRIYASENNVYVNIPVMLHGDIFIYDLPGREVARQTITGNSLNKISLDLPSGYYLVKVFGDSETAAGKVFIR